MGVALQRAALIAGAYIALASAWIIGSGAAVSQLADTAAELERLERYKGLFFVGGTGALLFLASYFVLRKLTLDLERAAKARETMLQLERHSLAGLFVSSIAHDANNVATVVKASLFELGKVKGLDADAREALTDAEDALNKLAILFKDLKELGRGETTKAPAETDLVDAVQHAAGLLHGHSLVKHCQVRVVADAPVRLPLYPVLLDQLLINLIINAADATQGRGHIELRVRADGADALLEVHDDGPGVPPEMEARLFKAFSTSKVHGTGLGLLSVKERASRHSGTVTYARSPLGGACFSVRLPLSGPAR